ncbi:DNA polymerase I [Labilithrix luteola]|uniref:DNA polymerase I n=1 Tax=Labilithrix luteola TaxID=1391654 RepID=A0A0K1PJB3_9BACT|nr:DNA polymerase [Labilithrix luteola]AKU93633.1 DNA polymerase I [Labilithrix luteola]
MAQRTLLAAATNLLARGFLVVPTDRKSTDGAPVNALFAVARAIHRVVGSKTPARAVAILESEPNVGAWPEILKAQLPMLPELFRMLGVAVIEARGEEHLVASYARAALEAGDDVVIAGVDKRFAQLVGDRLWWYDANKDVRYTPEIVKKRFNVPPAAVGEWLAMVGDDSGNEVLPGVAGLGAKGATQLVEAHGSIAVALDNVDAIDGRLGKVLRAAKDQAPRELARGRLDTTRPLPVALDASALAYQPAEMAERNAFYQRLGFAELLSADDVSIDVEIASRAGEAGDPFAKLGSDGPVAIHLLMEDPSPVRASIAGVSLANGNGEAMWIPSGSGAWPELATWLADPNVPKIGHDLVGTRVELSRAGIDLGGIVGDSACASHLTESSNWAPHDLTVVAKHALGRALPEDDAIRGVGKQRKAWSALPDDRVAAHAGRLADATAAIWRKLAPSLEPKELLAEYLEIEDVCVRMELTGILVDPEELDRAQAAFADMEQELDAKIFELAGHPFNINSGKQLGEVLFEELKLPVVGHTKTGWSTSVETLERIDHAHPIVALVLRWRELRRLRDSWVFALRRCIDADGRVHSRFQPARSFSGQIVNSNPDLGRVPGRTPEMARIRRAFVAPPGRLLMSVDFNQLGLHVLAHLTKDPALVEPLRRRADMHVLTAAAVFEVAPDAVTVEQRQLGKVINFATFAGQGASALALQLGVAAAEAKEYIARFDRHYAKVRAFQDEQLELARTRGYIVTLAGRHWPIGGLESLDSQARSYAERLARRATHEASVQDVSRRALVHADRAIRREGLDASPLLQILDEVLFDVPENQLERAAQVCSEAMRHAYELEVPLVVGVEAGKNWADLEPVRVASA